MAVSDVVATIINNALDVANSQTSLANAAADEAMSASIGYTSGTATDIKYKLTAVEPPIPEVENSILTYEAQLDKLIHLLSDQLAGFFTLYYPLASDAFDEATNWLVNTITVGGTGISPAVEDQIWQRARERVIADGRRAESQTLNEFTDRGFSLPAGALAARLNEIRFEQLTKTQEASRDVGIKQADIEIENLRFAVDLAVKSRMQAMAAATDYIRALMMSPDAAARVAGLNADAKARMMAATADLYRARLNRDEIALRVPVTNADNHLRAMLTNVDGFYKGIDSRVRGAATAADVYGRTAAAALSSLSSVSGISSSEFT